jgi:hypothetical protein
MYKLLVFLCLALPILATEVIKDRVVIEDLPEVELNPESKSGTISLSGSDTTSLFSNAIYVVPVLIFIILLDFAIFGAFATRSDDLNPVSNFFYHARRGLQIVREKSGRPGRPYNRHRYQRSIEMLGPVLDALTNTKEKYEN